MLQCKLCGHQSKSVLGYVSHHRHHRNIPNLQIPCPHDTCVRTFTSYGSLTSHTCRDHVANEYQVQMVQQRLPAAHRFICSDPLCGKGDSLFAANRYFLAVDGRVVIKSGLTTFLDGMAILMAMFYNFNITYPEEAAATLDFMQRCFLLINPERGSKTSKSQSRKKRITGVHPKVMALMGKMTDFEWRV